MACPCRLFAQAHPEPTVLCVNVLQLHPKRGTNARAENHQRDQRAVAQADDGRHLDAVDQARASSGASTGVLPIVTVCEGPRTDLAGFTGITWPVTSQSNRWRTAASQPKIPHWLR